MKNISVTDLMLVPELSHLRMLDFIDPKYNDLLTPVLKVLGFDLEYPVQFIPCQHRNLQGKVVIAYLLVGEVECNSSFLTSEWATAEDRVIVAGYKDIGLAQDMATSLTSNREYGREGAIEGFPPELTNKDEKDILMQIQVLTDFLMIVRGSPFKQDGSRATLAEYGVEEVVVQEARRKRAK